MSSTPEESGTNSLPRGEKIARMLVWTPLVVGAIAVAASQRSMLWRWAHDLIGDSTDLTARRAEQFARSIIGKRRATIVRLLGAPAATVGNDQWYYPVSGRERLALAVLFAVDRVTAAHVIHGSQQLANTPPAVTA